MVVLCRGSSHLDLGDALGETAGTLFLLGGVPDPASVLSGDFNLEALLAIIGGQAQRFRARRPALDTGCW